MLSDVELGHFEVITPQQYNGYPWCIGQMVIMLKEYFRG